MGKMKPIFKNSSNHTFHETFTVAELIKFLDGYPDDMPIVATWEGQVSGIRPQMFSLNEAEGYYSEIVLEIDVEEYRTEVASYPRNKE
jgi:hypothetical protein